MGIPACELRCGEPGGFVVSNGSCQCYLIRVEEWFALPTPVCLIGRFGAVRRFERLERLGRRAPVVEVGSPRWPERHHFTQRLFTGIGSITVTLGAPTVTRQVAHAVTLKSMGY